MAHTRTTGHFFAKQMPAHTLFVRNYFTQLARMKIPTFTHQTRSMLSNAQTWRTGQRHVVNAASTVFSRNIFLTLIIDTFIWT